MAEWYALRRIRHDRMDVWLDAILLTLKGIAGVREPKSLLPKLRQKPLTEKAMQARFKAMAACHRADAMAAERRLQEKRRKREERRGKNTGRRPPRG